MLDSSKHLNGTYVDSMAIDAGARFRLPAGTLYLDSAAQGPRLRAVLEAGHIALDASPAPWVVSAEAWEAQIEALRRQAAATLFSGDPEGLALVPSVAYAMATAARNVPLHANESVLVLEGQFPSNLLCWQQRCLEVGATAIAASRATGEDWTDAVLRALGANPQVAVVTLPHAHWHDGALLDLDRIAPVVRNTGAALVLDLSQSLGVLPLELRRWQPDFVAAVGHKWLLGPTGLAWMWVAPRWRDQGMPIEQHWLARDAGHSWAFPAGTPPPYRHGARRFDAGGVSDAARLAMSAAAFDQLQEWSLTRIGARLAQLTSTLDHALELHGLPDWKTPGHAPHLTALRPPTAQALDIVAAALLRESIICTRRAGLLRVAPHLHASDDDMRRVAEVVARALRG